MPPQQQQGYGMPPQQQQQGAYGGYGMPPQGYGSAPGYGGGYGGGGPQFGGPGGGRQDRAPPVMGHEDLERIFKTIHVAGIRGLRGQPGIQPGEEITEEDLAAFFGNDGEVRPTPWRLTPPGDPTRSSRN